MSKMDKAGYNQGDMKVHVEDYQRPMKSYSQEQFGKTTEYVSRQDNIQGKMASKLKSQSYKGRYS